MSPKLKQKGEEPRSTDSKKLSHDKKGVLNFLKKAVTTFEKEKWGMLDDQF